MRQRNNELGIATVGLLVAAFAISAIEKPVAVAEPEPDALITIESPLVPLVPGGSLPGPEKPDSPAPTDSGEDAQPPDTARPESPATTDPVDINATVQLIEVYHDTSSDQGSAVHIGKGEWLSCGHVFKDDNDRPWKIRFVRIAGRRVECDPPVLHPTLDVALIRTKKSDVPAAEVSTARPAPGQPLTVIGVKTDAHEGRVSHRKSSPRMVLESATSTEQGDSGAGVFDANRRVVGIQSGSLPGEIYFTPLSDVAELLSAPAAAGAHSPSAPSAADTGGFEVSLRNNGKWYWNDGEVWRHSRVQPQEGMRFSGNGATFIFHDGRMYGPDLILLFGAPWCGNCPTAKAMIPDLESLGWPVVEVNTDQKPAIAAHWRITSLPTFVVIRDGGEESRTVGAAMPTQQALGGVEASGDAAAAPTPYAEVDRILSILNPQPSETFVDYGCGDGRFLIAAASAYGCNCVGVEIDPERAAEARRNVAAAGLSHRIQIITGDVLEVEVDADVGVAYLYPDLLDAMSAKLQRLNRFASYLHPVGGLSMENHQGVYVWNRPPPQRYGYWKGRAYAGRMCRDPNCRMCNSIQSQIGVR